jgi:hypothetical protein
MLVGAATAAPPKPPEQLYPAGQGVATREIGFVRPENVRNEPAGTVREPAAGAKQPVKAAPAPPAPETV